MATPLGRSFAHGLKTPEQPSGYPKNWDKISVAFRTKCGYKCETCGVVCESPHTRLTHAHHKDGDKSNCAYSNLKCLCVYHHAQQPFHQHYKPNEQDMENLRRLWENQNIPLELRD